MYDPGKPDLMHPGSIPRDLVEDGQSNPRFRCHRTTRTDTGFRRLVFSLRGLVGGQDALSTLPLIAAARRSTVRARLTTGTSIIAPSNRTAPNP